MAMRPAALALLLAAAQLLLSARHASGCSWLYGCGEAWNRERLPIDFSYAGYKAGEASLPTKPVSVDIKALGAKGDGKSDDSWALQQAIDRASPGSAIYLPEGRYVITKRVDIRKQVVLRGAGRDKTALFYPKSLADLYGNRGGWGHGTCFINFWGWNTGGRLAGITGYAAKGSRKLYVDNTNGIRQGDWVRVILSDSSEVLRSNLMAGLMDAGWNKGGARNVVRFSSRVTEVGGGVVTLERALPWEVKTQWGPGLHAMRPALTDVGVEALTIEFAHTNYNGHLREDGFNAIHMNQVSNGWIKDVTILNADTGIYFWGVTFSTVQDVLLDTTRSRGTPLGRQWWMFNDRNGHRGVWSEFGESNLFTRIGVKAPYVHDLSVATAETGSVWSRSWGTDLNLDHHKGGPFSNLFTDLDMGAATRAFNSGGAQGAGPHSGAFTTFWNLRSAGKPLVLPDAGFGPALNFVGVAGVGGRDPAASRTTTPSWVMDGGADPPNLHEAMRKRRLGW